MKGCNSGMATSSPHQPRAFALWSKDACKLNGRSVIVAKLLCGVFNLHCASRWPSAKTEDLSHSMRAIVGVEIRALG